MPARRLLMRKIREILRLRHEQGLSHEAVAQACAVGVGTVNRYLRRAAASRARLAVAGRVGRRGARGPVVSPRRAVGWPSPARLRVHPPRAQARRRHPATPLGGVHPGSSERLPPHPVLRDLPAVGATAAAVDAAGAPRRREDVHRLLREAAESGRPAHGGAAARRVVCRRARRQSPHLRRGDRDPAVG